MICIHLYFPWSLNSCFKSCENYFSFFSIVFVELSAMVLSPGWTKNLWIQESQSQISRLKRLPTNSGCNSCGWRWSPSRRHLRIVWTGWREWRWGESWLKNWKIPAESKRKLQIRQTDGQIDRRVTARQLLGHHCRVLGLIKGWWGNITSEAGWGGTTQLLLLPTINRPSHNAMGHAPVASHRVEEDVFQGMAHILMVLEEEKKSVFYLFFYFIKIMISIHLL